MRGKETISVVYDDSYLGEGYFIIKEVDGEIKQWLKFYQSEEMGFPRFFIRGYETESRDNPNQEFRYLAFIMDENESAFSESIINLGCNLDGCIAYTVDPVNQGENHLLIKYGLATALILGKSVYKGKEVCSKFIDISLGDEYSSENYLAFQRFYKDLSSVSLNDVDTRQLIENILKLK